MPSQESPISKFIYTTLIHCQAHKSVKKEKHQLVDISLHLKAAIHGHSVRRERKLALCLIISFSSPKHDFAIEIALSVCPFLLVYKYNFIFLVVFYFWRLSQHAIPDENCQCAQEGYYN